MDDKKQVYEKPEIESEEIFERTALACDGSPFLNVLLNTKDSSRNCGYLDS